jgi:hypothetical protein
VAVPRSAPFIRLSTRQAVSSYGSTHSLKRGRHDPATGPRAADAVQRGHVLRLGQACTRPAPVLPTRRWPAANAGTGCRHARLELERAEGRRREQERLEASRRQEDAYGYDDPEIRAASGPRLERDRLRAAAQEILRRAKAASRAAQAARRDEEVRLP